VLCFFATDLHGSVHRYEKLFAAVRQEVPDAVLLGGDLLPHSAGLGAAASASCDFITEVLLAHCMSLRGNLQDRYPKIFLILGNDDPRCEEEAVLAGHESGFWRYMHERGDSIADFHLYGYGCVPPTPFLLKDWERYDVSRYVPPGCVSPEEGYRTVGVPTNEVRWGTIQQDLEGLVDGDAERAILLVHTPPADTPLDRASLDGKTIDHVPLDVHVGSIALRRFIEAKQPLLTLHGHVHESTRLTGKWMAQIGRTICINGAHDGPELSLVRFDPAAPAEATRELL